MFVGREVRALTEKEACYKIYCDAFGDDDFALKLFNNCYKFCHCLKEGETVVSMLFLLPCEIVYQNNVYNARYVFAVATDKKFRSKGYMSKFLKTISNDFICFLKPANDRLIDFYKKNGYKPFVAKKSREGEKFVKLSNEFLNLSESFAVFNNENYTLMYNYKNNINLDGLCFAYTME